MKMVMTMKSKANSIIMLTLLWVMQGFAVAEVSLPNGYYHTTIEDLTVKVLGGYIKASRTWVNGKWHHTRAWNRLEFEIDSLDGSVKLATRNSNNYSAGLSGSFTSSIHLKDTIEKVDTGYRWFDKKGNWIDYDGEGYIVKYGDKNNVEVSFIYNTNKQRIGVLDHFGVQRLWYEYVGTQISSVRDHADPALARKVTYNYTNGLLTSVIDVRGQTWSYEYAVFIEGSDTEIKLSSSGGTGGTYTSGLNLQNAKAHLRKITDPETRPTNIKYLPSGRTESVTKADGTGVFYKYDYNKTKKEYYVQTKLSSGRINEVWYDKEGEVLRRDVNGTTVETITINGRIYTLKNELGFETIREYDEFDNLTKVTHPDKSFRSYSYNTKYSVITEAINELGVKTKYDYYANGNLKQVTEALGLPEQRITTYLYDEFGNRTEVKRLGDTVTEEAKTTYIYDSLTTKVGNRLTKTVSVSATENHTTNYDSYNTQGNLLEWRDGRGKIWKQSFNKMGQRTSITDPLTHTTQFAYDKSGKLNLLTNALNKTHTPVYDVNGRLDKIIDPYLSEKRLAYNNLGQLITIFDEENHKQDMVYDAIGRVSNQIDGADNNTSLEYGIDKTRNVTLNQLAATNYPTFRQEYGYDNRGRVEKTFDVLSTSLKHETSRIYDVAGNLKTTTDAELKLTKYDYDNLNRLVTITYPDLKTSKYTYDNRDSLLTVTNEKQVVIRSYTYDHKNRLKTETWPTTKFTLSSYDENNNLVQMIDNKGQVTKNRYDDANRLDLKTYFINISATAAVKTVSFSYNNANTLTGYDDGTTSAVYVIDDLQRKTDETVNFGTFSKLIKTTYYKNSLKKTFTDAENIINSYLYDVGNRLSQISIPNEGSVIYNSYQWNSPEKITYPGGLTRTISYDPIMRTKHINNSDSASNSLMDYDYGYDKAGNIKTKTTEHGNYVYGYDDRYRLETVVNPVVPSVSSLVDEAYSYDDAGNRLTDASTTGNWNYNSTNQLTSYSDITIDYDDNGSTIKKTKAGVITTFDYNTENRLEVVKDNVGSTVATYYYDPFGRRLYKDVAGTRTYFMYAAEGLIAELDSAGAVTQSYGYTPQSTYGTSPLYTKTSVGYAYYQLDHLGTPQQLVNKTGAVVWKAKALAFGDTTVEVNTVINNLRFPGQYYDAETGTHYNYFRDYEPGTGRYVQSDPIGLGGGQNSYAYVTSQPVNQIDVYGLWGTWAHDYLIESFAEQNGFSENDIEAMQDGSVYADGGLLPFGKLAASPYQDPEYAHMHAMTSSKIPSKKKACEMANAFIKYRINRAEEFMKYSKRFENKPELEHLQKHFRQKAFFELGMAMHTVMDSKSPSHKGFQYWDGDASGHGPEIPPFDRSDESYFDVRFNKQKRDDVTRFMNDVYWGGTGIDCSMYCD